MQPETLPPAPAVVAVVVTCDPGPWFARVLESLAAQDYPNLSVLVVDAGGATDPTPMVAGTIPGAFVRRVDRRVAFGTAANEVLGIVEGASHYLICHDDVAFEPDAVRILVEEAFRSNAGITSPKYVMWEEPERLLAVGLTTDKVGAVRNLVEPGELDQQQHDAVKEILVAPSGATLVRADLFEALGGFDPVVDHDGEDLDLSWRARLAGARLVVVPAARVRHLQATRNRLRPERRSPATARRAEREADANRYRTVLACYRWFTLLWIVPLAVFWASGEAVTLALQGRFGDSWTTVSALGAALRDRGRLRAARHRVQSTRSVPDAGLRQLQVRGNARLRLFLRSRVDNVRSGISHSRRGEHGAPDGSPTAQVRREPPARGGWRPEALLVLGVAIVLLVGTRDLLGKPLPQLGTLPDTSTGWASLWRAWWTTWQPSGLGTAGPSSPALALLGILATVLFGAVGTLSHLVVLGPLLIGPFGAYRAARHWASRRGQMVAAGFYAVVPLPYNALARGHWAGLVAYAAAPWLLSSLLRLSAVIPTPATSWADIGARVVGFGVLVAVIASVAPSFLYVVVLTAIGLLIGSLVAGRPAGALRFLGVGIAGPAVAFVLLMPWSAAVLGSSSAVFGPDPGPPGRLGLGQVLRFHTGPFGSGTWEWLLLVAAALPLFIGRQWRLEWAARLWMVALVLFGVTWAGRRGWVPSLPPDVALAPAAAALALAAALGFAAFELDLPGYRFGWRQMAAATSALALGLAAIPFLVAAGNGRWRVPIGDSSSVLAFLPDNHAGDYRVLWVGQSDALPLAGRELQPGFAYATSFDGGPTLLDEWLPGRAGASPVLAADLRLVEGGLTTKLGHLLAPTGVRYIVVPNRLGPAQTGSPRVAVPASLLVGMQLQTDLKSIAVGDSGYSVFENSAWVPARAVLPAGLQVPGSVSQRQLQDTDLSAATPALVKGHTRVPSGSDLYVADTLSDGWRLDVAGRAVAPAPAFGWAMTFHVPTLAAGPAASTPAASAPAASTPAASIPARLDYSGPVLARLGDILQVILWIAAVVVLAVDLRRRNRRPEPVETVDPEWFAAVGPAPHRRRRYRADSAAPSLDDMSGDEVWTDV